MANKLILTIDDEEHILELLKYNLENNGYDVLQAESAREGLELLKANAVDLVLLDVMMPEVNGLEALKMIRSNKAIKDTPVIMLTAKSEEIDTVLGLEMGADDYIKKPFGIHELMARIKNVLKRYSGVKEKQDVAKIDKDIIECGDIVINKGKHLVYIDGDTIDLPHKEFELLYLLAKNKDRVFDRESLLEKIWGYDYYGETRTVDVHIRNLRKKIEIDDKKPKHIKTVRGVGYKFS